LKASDKKCAELDESKVDFNSVKSVENFIYSERALITKVCQQAAIDSVALNTINAIDKVDFSSVEKGLSVEFYEDVTPSMIGIKNKPVDEEIVFKDMLTAGTINLKGIVIDEKGNRTGVEYKMNIPRDVVVAEAKDMPRIQPLAVDKVDFSGVGSI